MGTKKNRPKSDFFFVHSTLSNGTLFNFCSGDGEGLAITKDEDLTITDELMS